mgnify:FL=1
MMKPWEVTLAGTGVDGDKIYLHLEDPEGWYSVRIKWDGCIELIRYHNRPLFADNLDPQDVNRLHICDLDDFIERLQSLRQEAVAHFGEDWGE